MEKTVTAAEANRQFSRILQGVRDGHSYIVTSHGAPVAQIGPVQKSDEDREAAKQRLLEHLRSQPAIDIGPWTRSELYDD